MKIQVFSSGGGCAPCKAMLRNVETAVAELKLADTVEYITRVQQLLDFGITASPTLVVNGEVKCSGQILDVPAIKTILAAGRGEPE